MPLAVAQALVWVLTSYALVGLAFAIPFVLRGAARLDAHAAGAPWGFRLLILPGALALWPLLALRWRAASRAGSLGAAPAVAKASVAKDPAP